MHVYLTELNILSGERSSDLSDETVHEVFIEGTHTNTVVDSGSKKGSWQLVSNKSYGLTERRCARGQSSDKSRSVKEAKEIKIVARGDVFDIAPVIERRMLKAFFYPTYHQVFKTVSEICKQNLSVTVPAF
ncbi:hypothetical protein DPMN_086211 [Dreissena polymorpha]|uniref:Uncharacterized protein n=1 Tax=Dreissena polymorpha TaxID=45954 RepID=A0A9D4BK24_DREPO|nr:hypothetical protein DPMN_086211 [Dreissena polymorpha]